jgi:hypothetical protein
VYGGDVCCCGFVLLVALGSLLFGMRLCVVLCVEPNDDENSTVSGTLLPGTR